MAREQKSDGGRHQWPQHRSSRILFRLQRYQTVRMDLLYYLLSFVFFFLVVVAGHAENPPSVHQGDDDDDMEDTEIEDTEDGTGQPLCPINDLVDPFADFDAYEYLSMADDEDLEDLEAIRILFSQNKRSRSIKFKHDRKDWDSHVRMLLATNEFDNSLLHHLAQYIRIVR